MTTAASMPAASHSSEVRPLSAESFASLASNWRHLGIWLSLWDSAAAAVESDAEGPRVWTTLWNRSASARSALREIVQAVLLPAGGASASAADARRHCGPANQAWGNMLGVTAIPIRDRRRTIGVVLAGWVRGEPGEDFVRLCDGSELDVEAMLRMAAGVPRQDDADVQRWRAALEHAIQQTHAIEVGADNIRSFTRNLEDTYEELNLVYKVSGLLSVAERPEAALARLGNEVLAVSKTSGLAFLLTPQPEARDDRGDASTPPRLDAAQPVMVQAGLRHADAHTVLDVAKALGVDAAAAPGHHTNPPLPSFIVRNAIADCRDLPAVASWIKHVVALPLAQGPHRLGVMLAINRTDGNDFDSVEVKFLRAVADQVCAFLENRRLYDDLSDLLMGILHALISSIDAKDPYTCGHSERVAAMSRRLAKQAGFSPEECERVYLAGLLHDVGKIGVPDAILCKPGKLTDDEFTVLRKHPEIGGRILSRIRQVNDLLPGVLHHHERMDGRGYPHRLAGHDIPILGRIICLADCFDAMTTNRTYRAALPVEVALVEIRRCAGTQFDPWLAEKFLEIGQDVMHEV